jgi:CIC family chloride channel protein
MMDPAKNLRPPHVPTDSTQTERQIASEIDEYLYVNEQRRRNVPRAVLVGIVAGAVGVAFGAGINYMNIWRIAMIEWAQQYWFGWVFPVGFTAIFTVASLGLARTYAPETVGGGVAQLEAVLRRYRDLNWRRVLPIKFIGSVLAIGGGLAMGPEGPMLQIGGSVGAGVGEFLKVTKREQLILIAAGAGAGLAAAFNAPLTGFIFVLEELQRDFRRGVFAAALVAAAVADIVARSYSGQMPVFAIPSYPAPPLTTLPFFVVLGVIAGLLGVLFNRTLIFGADLFGRIPTRWVLWSAAVVGGAVGLVGWFAPVGGGSGHALTEVVLTGQMALSSVFTWFIVRFAMTMASASTGVPGGIFAPLLTLGSLIGLGVGQVAHMMMPTIVTQPEVFAVVGMAAYFAAILRTPLTGTLLILEMTGNYWQLLPLMTACFCAYFVAEYLHDMPIGERQLERYLQHNGIEIDEEEPIVVEVEVQPESPFAGKLVRELGLPPGCILVSVRDEHLSQIPTADTRLTPYMRITAMIAAGSEESLLALHEGTEAHA